MGILPARPSGMPCSMYRNISSMMLPKSPRMLPSLCAFDVPFSQPENSGMCGNSESDSISIFSTEDSGRPRLRDLKRVNAYYFSIGFLGGQNPNMDQSIIWPQVFWDVRILTWIYQMVVFKRITFVSHRYSHKCSSLPQRSHGEKFRSVPGLRRLNVRSTTTESGVSKLIFHRL